VAPPVEAKAEPDIRDEILEAVEDTRPSMGFMRRHVEPVVEGGLRPLRPLEPMSESDYADMVGDALDPSRIMPPLMPTFDLLQEPRAGLEAEPRLRGFTGAPRQPLQFMCPYGLEGRCCGCRYLPCNDLTLAVMGHVARDYSPGGRCSADD
jgi:hypothetical protein